MSQPTKSLNTNGAGAYLQKHNVMSLFEDLAASLLYYQPDEPLEFLMKSIKDRIDAETEGIPLRLQLGNIDVANLKRPIKQLAPLSDFSKVSSALPGAPDARKKQALGSIRPSSNPNSPRTGNATPRASVPFNLPRATEARLSRAPSIDGTADYSQDEAAELTLGDHGRHPDEDANTVSALSVFRRRSRKPRVHHAAAANEHDEHKLSYKDRINLLSEPEFDEADETNNEPEAEPAQQRKSTAPGSPRVIARPVSRPTPSRPGTRTGLRPASRPLEVPTSKRTSQTKVDQADL